ncbi:tail tubular protein [Octadecabacter Antarctic BD virus 1]|nr:tail tubular protein [Octadecabacter Antarctic BD virus 1]
MAATTDIDICNMALDHLGKPPIVSFTESSVEAKSCLRQYDVARRMCLTRNPWTFSRKTRALSLLTDNDMDDVWTYHYDLPNDMLHQLRILEKGQMVHAKTRPAPSYIESGTIYANVPEARLYYVWDNIDTTAWTALFDDVVALFLAMRMAPSMTRRKSDIETLQGMYKVALLEAAEGDSQQETDTYIFDDGGYVDARDSGSDGGRRQADGSTIWS